MLQLAAGTFTLADAPFTFDARTLASEVQIVGAGGTTTLLADTTGGGGNGGAPLFDVSAGSPPVTLRNLVLRSQLVVSGGELHLDNCRFVHSSAEEGGALAVTGGALTADGTTFEACHATRGGAVHVSASGTAVFSGCTFANSAASTAQGGGAVWVDAAGNVVLRERTRLHGNSAAGDLDSIHIEAGGSATYVLPAPLAHYVDLARDGSWTADYEGQPALALKVGTLYRDYPSACPAGQYGDREEIEKQSSSLCAGLCPAGTVCGETATVTPKVCELGGYCTRGSSAARPCPAGRFGNVTGLEAAEGVHGCHACPAGAACGVGATAPIPCTPGTFAANGSTAACLPCPATNYQPASGATACLACGDEYYCPQGSSVRIPPSCSEGTYLPSGVTYTNQSNCEPCRIGTWCAGGRSAPKLCGVGSYANVSGLPTCTDCRDGNYQDERGATGCKICPIASFCSGMGASASTPCPGGTWSNITGLRSQHECTKVVKGEWAPTGSAAPKLCPESGFYCPGYDADTTNDPPGSEPIIIDSGASRMTREVPVVSFGVTLETTLDDYDEDDTKARLAILYNVSVDSISLAVEAGSLQLTITILPPDRSDDGVAALTDAIESKSVEQMSAVLGSNATVTTTVQTKVVEEEYEATCPKGKWCSAGVAIDCGENTYNDETDENNQGACRPCPPDSVSPKASESIEACVCKPGYYDVAAATEVVQCMRCKTGSDCPADVRGLTLEELPVLRGYYRTSNRSDDLRRCPDFGNRSGCVGGIGDGEGPCKEWLMGPYCRLCNVSTPSRYYNVEQSACLACEGDAAAPIMLGGGLCIAALIIVQLWARFKPHRNVPALARLARWAARLSAQLSLRPKGKQLLGFYQIATRVSDVYDVPMPDGVAQLLSFFEVLNVRHQPLPPPCQPSYPPAPPRARVPAAYYPSPQFCQVNIAGIGLPLQCLELGTYEQQLSSTMLAPLVLAGAVVFGFVFRSCCGAGAKDDLRTSTRRHRVLAGHQSRLSKGLLEALPWLLTLSFLVFPMVSSAAFRAFSCEDFDNGRSYLRADYSIECSTATHVSEEYEAVRFLAWTGILLYPVGISITYGLLMLRARSSIITDRPTALSKALGFLVRDYEPAFFWWELLEAWKKLGLVGFAVIINPGSIPQLVAAFIFSLIFMLLTAIAAPFKDDSDDYFAKACGFALSAVFFFSVILKISVLTDAVDDVLTDYLRQRFSFNVALVSVGMIASIVGALLLAGGMAINQLVAAARKPLIKLVATKSIPNLPLQKGHHWHLFLSHIWGTGQDQCATIKRQLSMLMPDVSIFLDVDARQSEARTPYRAEQRLICYSHGPVPATGPREH